MNVKEAFTELMRCVSHLDRPTKGQMEREQWERALHLTAHLAETFQDTFAWEAELKDLNPVVLDPDDPNDIEPVDEII